ncbi:MBL fold metallo-hydrolase [Oceanobacillus piezotolerans]|uniref:MBL fold metallo-hydrolase n=1 Tax=Oceanobacillus piezotolerans TaxID=2448030 RepID=A0A498DF84_9BACI|nr:MBL fold metallo-hydrolase [Oceanobacillus piezotolerans]RLL42678.1 MBL fold metallo-hydrolase [Oceanobacillus piezotolerans]
MLKKLTDKVYYMPHYSETDRPALGLICGDSFSLIVDSGNSPGHAQDFLNLAEEMEISPIKGVILTHWHWDHVFGIKTMGQFTISHEKTKEKIEYMKTLKWDDASLDQRVETGEEIDFCRNMIKLEMPERDHLELQAPDLTFNNKLEIDLGDITCVVEHVGGVHADDSSIVYIPEEKVMFLGDCVYQDFYSGEWSYDLEEFNTLLNKIEKYDAEYYVTGHQHPKTYKDMWHVLNEIKRIGELVDKEHSFDQAVAKFSEIQRKTPNEEQMEFILNFVNGNRKKKGMEGLPSA